MLRDPALIPLSQQHHNGLVLGVLTRRSLAADASEANVARLAQRAVDRYELELANHFELEERVLFPAIQHTLGRQPMVAELIAQHREIENLVGQLRTAPSAELLERFCTSLAGHIRREENELFQTAQARLPAQVLEELGRVIDAQAVRVCLS